MGTRRRFTREFKQEAVRLVRELLTEGPDLVTRLQAKQAVLTNMKVLTWQQRAWRRLRPVAELYGLGPGNVKP